MSAFCKRTPSHTAGVTDVDTHSSHIHLIRTTGILYCVNVRLLPSCICGDSLWDSRRKLRASLNGTIIVASCISVWNFSM